MGQEDGVRGKDFKHLAGSLLWLGLLYGGLLHVAVGALGVSELSKRLGDESANIIHMVDVANDIRQGEMTGVRREEATLGEREAALGKAIHAFRNFGAALLASGTAVEDLAAGIGAAPSEVEDWVGENQPVPPLQQRLIAAWLHLPERELFTDQAPATEAAANPIAMPGAAAL